MIESNDIHVYMSHRDENKIYFEKRKEIKSLIKNMNTCLDNNSSTFFLALFYMDLIFENYLLEDIIVDSRDELTIFSDNFYKINHYVLLSLACLVIASKFNEKDPHVPDLNSFLRIYTKFSKFYFVFTLNELMKAEVNVLKILKYKLNYFSLYQFIIFFFANGILFEKNIRDSDLIHKSKYSEKKILEKIYVKSREILDIFIDDYDNYNTLFNGNENYITAIEILLWAIENTLKIQIINEDNYFFPLYYQNNFNYSKHIQIYSIIDNIINKNEIFNKNISDNTFNNKYNYNFNYGNYFIDSQMSIFKNNNKNLCLMSVSNSNNNFDDYFKKQKISSDYKTQTSKSLYFFKDNNKNDNIDYYGQINDFKKMNSDNTNLFNSRISNDIYQEENKINENEENANKNIIMSSSMIPIISKESKELKKRQREGNLKRNDLYRNLTKELTSNLFQENDMRERKTNYHNIKSINNSKNLFNSVNNFNDISLYSINNKKNFEKKNSHFNNNYYIAKRINKDIKSANKRNINIEYNNSSKSTFYKSLLNNTNPSPKDILNKTKKIFDETNKRNIDYENKNMDSSSIIVNSYKNKSNYNNYKEEVDNKNYNLNSNISNTNLNSNLSEHNIIYKIKDDYINNTINKYKEEKSKENTIIINNNIQINNYVEKENNFSNYFNNSQQNISDIENINFENYINKKYFNINKNSKSIFLNNNIKNKKVNKDKNKKKLNFKKINFLEEINEQLKENKNNNNDFSIVTKNNKEILKINKDKNNRLLNLGQFQTYFDYSSFGKYKGIESSQRDYNLVKHINYNNSSIIEKNSNNYVKYNNLELKGVLNNKNGKINHDSHNLEKYTKLNSNYII